MCGSAGAGAIACARRATGADLWHGGVFREVVPPERLVFTFAWEEEGERGIENVVTITFTEQGRKTLMNFRQTPFQSAEERDGHQGGWGSAFDRLDDLSRAKTECIMTATKKAITAGRHATSPSRRVFDAPRDLVFRTWTEPEHLAQWWGPRGFTNPVCELDVARRRRDPHSHARAGRHASYPDDRHLPRDRRAGAARVQRRRGG